MPSWAFWSLALISSSLISSSVNFASSNFCFCSAEKMDSSSVFASANSSELAGKSASSAHVSTGDTMRLKPSIQDTKPIDSFLVAYFGFLMEPLSFLCSIISFINNLSSKINTSLSTFS